ncbi:hypothetical protein GCM10027020_04040 [Nocardioides salsibiostraticola]
MAFHEFWKKSWGREKTYFEESRTASSVNMIINEPTTIARNTARTPTSAPPVVIDLITVCQWFCCGGGGTWSSSGGGEFCAATS